MEEEYQIDTVDQPEWGVIGPAIHHYNPEFYKQHGYRVFGELPDFPPGHQRYFLTKEL